MTHHEKDLTSYLEKSISKIDAAIVQQQSYIKEYRNNKSITTAYYYQQLNTLSAIIIGLQRAKEILLRGLI
jgi:hypothetical protein